jgi:hypothetical protein
MIIITGLVGTFPRFSLCPGNVQCPNCEKGLPLGDWQNGATGQLFITAKSVIEAVGSQSTPSEQGSSPR